MATPFTKGRKDSVTKATRIPLRMIGGIDRTRRELMTCSGTLGNMIAFQPVFAQRPQCGGGRPRE
ncbi:hypothetical protein Acsp02_73120 [Actinoplanes sp. NBRC 103695]|nr:hypothetical protein Acsp02_73120 [Actinoplanes sp. NBRC 103695]